jgi:NAD(P)-dependent dehydrogenase (short-subunit alcohol dehydrogenase family)
MATTKRIALVTGGMGGLGEAICIKLAKLGDTVATTYSPGNTKAQEWIKSMKEQGYHFYAYLCDVTDWVEQTNLFIVVQNAKSNFLHVAYASLNGRRFPYGLIYEFMYLAVRNVKMQGSRENAGRQMERYKDADAVWGARPGEQRGNGESC